VSFSVRGAKELLRGSLVRGYEFLRGKGRGLSGFPKSALKGGIWKKSGTRERFSFEKGKCSKKKRSKAVWDQRVREWPQGGALEEIGGESNGNFIAFQKRTREPSEETISCSREVKGDRTEYGHVARSKGIWGISKGGAKTSFARKRMGNRRRSF